MRWLRFYTVSCNHPNYLVTPQLNLLTVLTPLISAQNLTTTDSTTPANTTTTPQSTFYLPETQTQFSISINNSTTQDAGVYIYFTSPAYSWVGVGFGSTMENSLMFIMYPSARGDGAVFSPRSGSKNAEPSWDPSVSFHFLNKTSIDDDMMTVRVKCADCIGGLGSDPSSVPMMYAFGPGSALYSNELDAGLKRHVRYGHFTMDLVAASGQNGGVPGKSDANSGVTMVGEMVKDRDYRGIVHAVLGCLALFVIWPINVLIAGFIKSRRWHVGVSILVFVFLIVAFAVGGALSPQYNRVSRPILLTSLAVLILTWICSRNRSSPRIRSSPSSPSYLFSSSASSPSHRSSASTTSSRGSTPSS